MMSQCRVHRIIAGQLTKKLHYAKQIELATGFGIGDKPCILRR